MGPSKWLIPARPQGLSCRVHGRLACCQGGHAALSCLLSWAEAAPSVQTWPHLHLAPHLTLAPQLPIAQHLHLAPQLPQAVLLERSGAAEIWAAVRGLIVLFFVE